MNYLFVRSIIHQLSKKKKNTGRMADYMIDLKEPTMMRFIENIHSRQQTVLGQVKRQL